MKKKIVQWGLGLTCVGVVSVVGCANLLPRIPTTVDLGNAGLDSFAVESGVPLAKTGTVSIGTSTVEIGSGDIEIALDAISVDPANGGGGKLRPTQQDVNACLTACDAAGVDEETCNQVCQENELLISVRISDSVATVCDDGELYEFVVALDDDGNPTSIEVDPSELSAETIALLNGGSFAICIEVISPITGDVIIDGLTFNLGL